MGQINITLSPETVAFLTSSNSKLYAMKAVQSSDARGLPLVWYSTAQLFDSMTVAWGPPLAVYIAPTDTFPVVPGSQTSLLPGQLWKLGRNGVNEVINAGPATALSIGNETTSIHWCGMLQATGSAQARPLCVFPLGPSMLETITPLDVVVLLFSSDTFPLGSVFQHPWSNVAMTRAGEAFLQASFSLALASFALVVDTTNAPNGTRSVTYDKATSWTWGDGVWATPVAPWDDFQALLIRP